jgi:hypothetical protein
VCGIFFKKVVDDFEKFASFAVPLKNAGPTWQNRKSDRQEKF